MDPTVFLPCPVSGCAAQLRPCVATSMFFVRRGSPTGPRAAYRVLHVDYVAKTMTLSEEEIEDGTTCAVAEHYFDERDGHNVAS